MKTLKLLFLIFICFGLIISCSKDEELLENQDEMLKKASKKGHVPTFVVEPTGTDDTENLKNAFADAMDAGSGAVVQLAEGTFLIDFIEIREFDGEFRGAGLGKSILTNIGTLDNNTLKPYNQNFVLLRFVGGDVCMRNMTVQYNMEFSMWFHGLVGFSGLTPTFLANNEYINVVVDNVEFKGHPNKSIVGLRAESGYWKGPNVLLSDIDIKVNNCFFNDFRSYGALIMEIRKGTVVAGSKGKGNVFNNCDLGIWHNVDTKITVENNTFSRTGGWFPLQIINGPWREDTLLFPQKSQSVCNVEKNTFNVSAAPNGGVVIINDRRRLNSTYKIPMLVQVKNNKIHCDGGMFTGMGGLNLSGAVIRNNKFSGESDFGIRIFSQSPDVYCDNGLLLGNNFSNASYDSTCVLLGYNTRNWTVVGGNIGEDIWDYGENNLISGFNNNTSDDPFGQTIVDNLREIKNPMHDLKKGN